MDIREFLQLRGSDLPSMVASLRKIVTPCSGDQYLAVGSLVEGLGNIKSDIDIWLVRNYCNAQDPDTEEITVVAGQCVVDVKIVSISSLTRLIDRLDGWAKDAWDTTSAAKFTTEERIQLHRLQTGVIISTDIDESIPRPNLLHLARLKLHVARHLGRTIQIDMAGYRSQGDFRTLIYASHELLGHAIDALLAGYMVTNATAKWRYRLLDTIPSDWESKLISWHTGLAVNDRIWDLYRLPHKLEPSAALEYAFRVVNFARSVFVSSEHILLGTALLPRPYPQVQHEKCGEFQIPNLDLDVDYTLSGDRVLLGRLNEFTAAIELTFTEFALSLLFDGEATVEKADNTGLGLPGTSRQLAARLKQANLMGALG